MFNIDTIHLSNVSKCHVQFVMFSWTSNYHATSFKCVEILAKASLSDSLGWRQ